MPGIVGGVIGAVLAVFGAPLVQGPPPLAPEAASRLASVESSTAALGEQVGGLQQFADDLEPTVRAAVEAAVAEVPSQDAAAMAALDERLATLAGEVSAMADAAAAAVDPVPLLNEQSERLTALRTTLAALEGRLTAESERLDAARGEAVAALEASIAAEAQRVAAVGETAAAELGSARDALGDEIAELRGILQTSLEEITVIKGAIDGLQQVRSRAAAAALLAREIDRTIDAGEGFEQPLDRLLAMAGEDPELESALTTLRPYAGSGVPTIERLRADLAALADTAPTPAVAGYEWLGQTVENIRGLVTVRDHDNATDVATGRLGEADAALRDGDVATAIAIVGEVAATPDAVDAATAERWLADARARLTAMAAQEQLDTHIRELLTATVN